MSALKKVCLMMLCLTLMVGALASCGNSGDNGAETSAETKAETSAQTSASTSAETSAETKHTHAFGEWTVSVAATCTNAGEETRSCACGEKETRPIDTIDHNVVDNVCTMCEKNVTSKGLAFSSQGDGTCALSSIGACSDTEIYIPSISPAGDIVTIIRPNAFEYCENITKVVIPDSVTMVGANAFNSCTGLTSLTLGKGVAQIGVGAFGACFALENITIPDSVTNIGQGAFAGTAYYDNETNWENGVLYIGNCLIESKTDISGAYAIKEGTKVIADYAFENRDGLTSVTIPYGVTNISLHAFDHCDILASVTIPESVTSIGKSALANCGSLESITIPDSVISIGDSAFWGSACVTNTTNNAYYVGDHLIRVSRFASGTYTINLGTKIIGSNVFGSATGPNMEVTAVVIPDSVTSICSGAFANISYLESIRFTGTMEQWKDIVKDHPWPYNFSVTQVQCSDGWIDINASNDVTDDDNDNSDTQTPAYTEGLAFKWDQNRGGYLVSGYTGTDTEIIIPPTYNEEPVKGVAYKAFYNNSSITNVILPENATYIDNCAFLDCGALIGITLPNSITFIGDSAFSGCISLASIDIPAGIQYICGSFNRCESITSLTLPEGMTTIYDSAFSKMPHLASVIIPKSVTSIQRYAFAECSELSSITYNGTVAEWGAISLGDGWVRGTAVTKIVCSDGEVTSF